MANLNFDATEVAPNQKPDPLPAGKYTCIITDSEIKVNSRGTGQVLSLELTVIDGEYRGRKVRDYLNINHQKADTQAIDRGKLSAICHAVGVKSPRDTIELHQLALTAIMVVQKSDQYGLSNDVKGYEKRPQATPQVAPQQSNERPAWIQPVT
jgi:hypothetical protein